MRLWHEALLPFLPRQQLLGQHRECCALRGLGWGKPHSVVNYVFTHPYSWLVAYHWAVMREMQNRGYTPAEAWKDARYRGKAVGYLPSSPDLLFGPIDRTTKQHKAGGFIYPEHDAAYLRECLDNLEGKGIYIDMEGMK